MSELGNYMERLHQHTGNFVYVKEEPYYMTLIHRDREDDGDRWYFHDNVVVIPMILAHEPNTK